MQDIISYDPKISEVVVRKRTTQTIRTPFSVIGVLTNRHRKGKLMAGDVFDLLDQVSKGAFSVFNNLKFNRSETDNITRYVNTEMSKTEKESLSRRLKELKDVGLICRVKKTLQSKDGKSYNFKDPRNTFIINPELIRCMDHGGSEYLWKQCIHK